MQELKRILAGRKVSILADSISTFEGWSNNTAFNSTIGQNYAHYNSDFFAVERTWWKQLLDKYSMELIVNNAWGGSIVAGNKEMSGWKDRCLQLQNNAGQMPELIFIMLGINDLWWDRLAVNLNLTPAFYTRVEADGFLPVTFDEALAVMLHKMTARYTDADIFYFTLPKSQLDRVETQKYNQAIMEIGRHYGCRIIDIYRDPYSDRYESLTTDGIHPNEEGMQAMAKAAEASMKEYYLQQFPHSGSMPEKALQIKI